ncbi:Uncharacterised protein [uncultured archaeon]|nr:Uncharacterised protein [uncultured archaeon]
MTKDIEEITLALTLLGVVTAVVLKINDFFNNNVIILNANLYGFVNGLITFLLVEFLIIFLFFIFKGISIYIEPQKRNDDFKKNTRMLFKLSFIYAFVWFIDSIFIFIFIFITTVYYNYLPPWYNKIAYLYGFSIILISLWLFFDLLGSGITEKIKEIHRNLIEQNYRLPILFIIIGILLIIFQDLYSRLLLDIVILPSYLLAGSYSIEEFPQSIDNADNLTFTIKETGIPYNFNYIRLDKINSNSNLTQYVDNIKINRTQETQSNETFMLGENYYGIWYLVINTSRLQCKFHSGTYMLHAEVTDEPSENSTFGVIQKRADKLFYIAPKNANCSFNST